MAARRAAETPTEQPILAQNTPKTDVKVDISDVNNLDTTITMALNQGKRKLTVTKDVLKSILRERFKEDASMIYRNVELVDVERQEEVAFGRNRTMKEVLFGKSKVVVRDNRPPAGKS